MASFASQPVQFTPYIPPTNLEADNQRMNQRVQADLQVGMYKQQQYQLGVQKIQGLVDNIMGLQVSKDVDKEYLSNLQSETMSNVRKIAGQDLSKQSLINQAGTYASAIFNDQNVRNAVASTQNMQDALAQVQKAHEDGKSGTSNDWAIMKRIQAWQNDGKVGSTLGKQQYTNFYNYQESFQKFMQGKHGNVIVEQKPNGQWDAYTMTEGRREYIDPIAVKNDAQTFFATNVQASQQLDLDSDYYADNTSDESVLQGYTSSMQSQLNSYDRTLNELRAELNTDPTKSQELSGRIQQYENQRTKLSTMIGSAERDFLSNPRGFKKQLFKSNVLDGFAQRFAYEDLQSKTISNPAFQAKMEQSRYDLSVKNAELDQLKFEWNKVVDKSNFDLRNKEYELKLANAQGKSLAEVIPMNAGAFDTENLPTAKDYVDQVKRDYAQSFQNQAAMLYTINPEMFTVGEDSNGNTMYSLKRSAGYTQEDFQEAYNKAKASYDSNPLGVNSDIRDFFSDLGSNSGVGMSMATEAKMLQVTQLEKQVRESLSEQGIKELTDDKDPYTGGPIGSLTRGVMGFLFGDSKEEGSLYKGTEYNKRMDEAFKPLIQNQSGATVTQTVTKENQTAYNLVRGFADAYNPQMREELANVESQKGDLRYTIQKLPNGKFQGIISKGGATASFELTDQQVMSSAPNLLATDPLMSIRELMKARAEGNATRRITLGQYITPQEPNLQTYRIKADIEKRPGGFEGDSYKPIVYFQKSGESNWTRLPFDYGYSDLQSAQRTLTNIGKLDDATFEAKALNNAR